MGENTEVSVLLVYMSKLKDESPAKLTSIDINDICNMSETLLKHGDRNAKVLIGVQTLQENFKHFNIKGYQSYDAMAKTDCGVPNLRRKTNNTQKLI